jgi:hypothetical protein
MMLRDAVLEGATAAEVVALARLADDDANSPPPHLCPKLRAKGWLITTATGHHLLTLAGRTLVERV